LWAEAAAAALARSPGTEDDVYDTVWALMVDSMWEMVLFQEYWYKPKAQAPASTCR
jgi:hypothetical protein